jgi:dienelactone hydrolase
VNFWIKPHHQKQQNSLRFFLIHLLLCSASLTFAQNWTVQTIPTRAPADGKITSIAFATLERSQGPSEVPPVRHVLVYPQPGGRPQLKVASGNTNLTMSGPWVRAADPLKAQGVAVVYVDPPSDAANRGLNARPQAEIRQDFAAVGKQMQRAFPAAQMHLVGFATVAPLLDIADAMDGFSKVLVASSILINNRRSDWSQLRKPVLMLHAPSAQCNPAPFLEAQLLAKRSRFTLLQVGYAEQKNDEDCGRDSQHQLPDHEVILAKTVADWLDGKAIPSVIGHANPAIAWREEIISYPAPSAFGSHQLEATLLLPIASRFGNGPYPVLVWNHGDVELDFSVIREKSRIRDMPIAREFLQLGVAVLMPARRGVGLSEGSYPRGFSAGDADATYKARVHAEDILPALTWIKSRAEINSKKIILSGQSAGGYSTMYIASQNPEGLIGAIDFSGGRTDKHDDKPAGYLNQMMVDGFEEFGKTTRVPTLWVFAENDSRYSVNTIRASHEAYQAAGGKARLLLNPPIEGDGHHIYHQPKIWRAAIKTYLQEIGVVSRDK